MMNKWRDFIAFQDDLSKHCDYKIKDTLKKNMQHQQMQMGFRMARAQCLVERPNSTDPGSAVKRRRLQRRASTQVDENIDNDMIALTAMQACDYKNEKVRQFVEEKEI